MRSWTEAADDFTPNAVEHEPTSGLTGEKSMKHKHDEIVGRPWEASSRTVNKVEAASSDTPLLPPSLLAQLQRLELVSRKLFRGRMKGEKRSPRKGQSVEFADFRSYVPGDDLRFVDWNLYARLDKLFLKLYLEEEDLHFHGLIDSSASMTFGEPSKFRFAKQLAGALGFIGLCRADRVRLEPLGQASASPTPTLRGRRSLWRMVDYLEEMEPAEPISLAKALRHFCARNQGKGIVVLISDLLDKEGFEEGLRYLVAQQMDVYVIHVLAPEELHPEIRGDFKMVDCEDGDEAEVSISQPLLERYQRTLAAFTNRARTFCGQRGITYIRTSSGVPVAGLVTGYLQQRGLVK